MRTSHIHTHTHSKSHYTHLHAHKQTFSHINVLLHTCAHLHTRTHPIAQGISAECARNRAIPGKYFVCVYIRFTNHFHKLYYYQELRYLSFSILRSTTVAGKYTALSAFYMGWLRSVGPYNYRSLLQNIVCFIGLFCKRDL